VGAHKRAGGHSLSVAIWLATAFGAWRVSARRLRGHLRTALVGTATAVCSQGGVIPDLLTRLVKQDGSELPPSFAAKKGSVWVADLL